MRRSDRQISESDSFEILEKGEYGILSMVNESNEPYGIPVNYCVVDDALYFHCDGEGLKTENLEINPSVSFCVVGFTEVQPDRFGTLYESCIVRGSAAEIYLEEKQKALEGIILKYSENFVPEGARYIEKLATKTRVFRIAINTITGKARR
jgi:nitroimidazol reductase NimA-like FMN-containing flavoprotein (pyridoxamine 5'-phosphate oxidase superfamily)